MTDGLDLESDCRRCLGLCCVALAFTASTDFAEDKPAGQPCRHLDPDDRCRIHDHLVESGYPACAAFECFGAGQRVTQATYGGRSRRGPDGTPGMLTAFTVVRQLHEMLWYLREARARAPSARLADQLAAAWSRTDELAGRDGAALAGLDVAAHRRTVAPLLRRTSAEVRARHSIGAASDHHTGADHTGADHTGADLSGADLTGTDLRAASLRGARLLGTVLASADLRYADLLGADLRGADVRGADLRGALFLTPQQLGAARGDAATRLDDGRRPPGAWAVGAGPGLSRRSSPRS